MDNSMGGGEMMKGKTCSCPHHKVVPALILVIAVAALAGNLGYLSANVVGVVWPVCLGVIGIMKLMEGGCKCC